MNRALQNEEDHAIGCTSKRQSAELLEHAVLASAGDRSASRDVLPWTHNEPRGPRGAASPPRVRWRRCAARLRVIKWVRGTASERGKMVLGIIRRVVFGVLGV